MSIVVRTGTGRIIAGLTTGVLTGAVFMVSACHSDEVAAQPMEFPILEPEGYVAVLPGTCSFDLDTNRSSVPRENIERKRDAFGFTLAYDVGRFREAADQHECDLQYQIAGRDRTLVPDPDPKVTKERLFDQLLNSDSTPLVEVVSGDKCWVVPINGARIGVLYGVPFESVTRAQALSCNLTIERLPVHENGAFIRYDEFVQLQPEAQRAGEFLSVPEGCVLVVETAPVRSAVEAGAEMPEGAATRAVIEVGYLPLTVGAPPRGTTQIERYNLVLRRVRLYSLP